MPNELEVVARKSGGPGAARRNAPPVGRLSMDNPWLTVEMLLTLEAGKMFSTAARARKFLFSTDLGDEDLRRHAARLGRESIRTCSS